MKKLFLLSLAAFTVVAACDKKEADVTVPKDTPSLSEGRVITVRTLDTKSAITAKQEGGYSFTWKENDAIKLFEFVYENYGNEEANATADDYFFSDGLGADAQSASFTVSLNTTLTVPDGAKYRYVCMYPSDPYPSNVGTYWTADQSTDNDYATVWPDSECSANHPVLFAKFPYRQYPTATSFDPLADWMVSQPLVLDNRAENAISLQFARVGAIVKVTLTGLPAGEKVETGYILFGDSYKVCTKMEYDPEVGAVRFVPADEVLIGKESWEYDYRFGFYSNSAIEINPTDVFVNSDGKADLWIRLPEGKVTDSFFVRVWTRAYQDLTPGEWHSYGKSVDLSALNKSLTFANGRLTTFSVATQEMSDPYLKLSYSYTDGDGNDQTAVSENGYIQVGQYGAYLLPGGGTVILDVETNADPADIVINDCSDWADCSFDPATMKLTLTYAPCSEYSNYMVSNRESYIYVGLSSFAAADVQMSINQLKPYFADSGTRKSVLTWHGGSVTGSVRCNAEPVIECLDNADGAVSWTSVKTDTGYDVTFTLTQNETDALNVREAYIRDSVNPDTKYLKINLIRYPMVPEGTYYIVTRNDYSGTTPYPWFAACSNDDVTDPSAYNPDVLFPTQVPLDGDNNLDFDHTDHLRAFTFTRIEGSDDYRISCKINGITYYLYQGKSRTSSTLYACLASSAPVFDSNGKDLSRWDVLSLDDRIALLNHVYADLENHTNSFSLHFDLGSTTQLYLAQPAYVQITYNKGSYGTSYFGKTYSYFLQPTTPYCLRLYDVVNGAYLP